MKIAITGKGGVGKTTLSALLSHIYASEGRKVIAVDADPDANLSQALGVSKSEIKKIRPIAEMSELIEERTGARPGTSGGIFKINPKVDDIPEGFGYKVNGINLLVMGTSKVAAAGCYCPENALLRRLLKHLVTERDEVVIADMEAGVEHLTRGTAEGVDAFIVVVEPGQRSLQTAVTVQSLAQGLGIKKVFVVANKVRNEEDVLFVRNALSGIEFLGAISFNNDIMESDIKGLPPYRASERAVDEAVKIKETLESLV
ncbi:MAG: carbon monoxide dehydrogenase accessory protein CooC [Thermodesulfovibrionia bacterium]|nr:MAG: carbon monoxide dehydrogenase accessory protein CooC [Thermodesulfovibrionia bacterium]